MIELINRHDLDQHSKTLSDYLPGGKLWAAKNLFNSKMYQFIRGLSSEHVRAEEYLRELQKEFIPDETLNFVEDWEKALGIPDDCFSGTGDLEIRRRDVLIKLASLGVQTAEDFQNIAALFGVTATVVPGEDATPTPLNPKFTIVVEFISPTGFPFTFPIVFGSSVISVVECLFNKLKPANCVVIFTQVAS